MEQDVYRKYSNNLSRLVTKTMSKHITYLSYNLNFSNYIFLYNIISLKKWFCE